MTTNDLIERLYGFTCDPGDRPVRIPTGMVCCAVRDAITELERLTARPDNDDGLVRVEIPLWLARFLVWTDFAYIAPEVSHTLREACAWAVVEATADEEDL